MSEASTPPSPSLDDSNRRRPFSVSHGDLSTRLDKRPNPDEWTLPDGTRKKSHKYARSAFPTGRDLQEDRRTHERANVSVPFATEPSALREFLWGLIHGFGDLASIVRGALTCDRTVLDKLPYRDRASPRPGGAVDPEKLEKVLDAQRRGLFRRDGDGGERTASHARATTSSPSRSAGGYWKRRRGGVVADEGAPDRDRRRTVISTWTLPDDDDFDRRHRLAPRPKKETVGKGLALIAAINVALLWAGSRAPTGG